MENGKKKGAGFAGATNLLNGENVMANNDIDVVNARLFPLVKTKG